jgi:hypothetical protein
MKSLMIATAVLVLGLVGTVSAADVSKSTLAEMGFVNATVMSDVDGLEIRGKGTSASVFGASIANFNNQYGQNSATNGYEAASQHYRGSALAKGENKSFAGNVNSEWFSKNFAGGSSKAYAR